METMNFYIVNTPPAISSPEGTYYVENPANPDKMHIYIVSGGEVRKQEDSTEQVALIEN